MTAKERIAEFLVRNPMQAYCEDCLSTILAIQPRQQVQQKTAQLSGRPCFARSRGRCDHCSSNRIVIRSWTNPGDHGASAPVTDQSPPRNVVLISCVSKKLSVPVAARDLYVSSLFRMGLRYAESRTPDAIYILSAKHGLVELDQQLSPYEESLIGRSDAEIAQWAQGVVQQLGRKANLADDHFLILAGERYRRHLIPHLRHVEVPMEGLGIGKQISFLKQRLANDGSM